MTTSTILIAALLAGSSSPAAEGAPAPQGPTWRAAAGSRLRIEVESRHELASERDERITGEGSSISQRTFDLDTTIRLAVLDELVERDEQRPLRLERLYEGSSFEIKTTRSQGRQQTKDVSYAGKGSVEGTGVVFTWVPEENEYGRYFDRREGTEESLPGLEVDLTLRGLLPGAPVEPGASWSPPISALRGLLTTGGDCDWQLDDDKGLTLLRTLRVGLGMNLEQAFGGEEEGEVKVTWLGTEEVEGRRLALLDIEFDVKLDNDVTERARASTSMVELSKGMQVDSARIGLTLQGGGRLRWDLEGGHLHDTVDLVARERCRIELTQVAPAKKAGEEPPRLTQLLVMAGRLEHSIRCTRFE